MSSNSIVAAALNPSARAVNAAAASQAMSATPGATTTGTAVPAGTAATGTAGATQAQAGAQQVEVQAEPFNAPMLSLPDSPTTDDVLTGLSRAMADPRMNKTTAKALTEFHGKLLEYQKTMIQTIIDGIGR